MSREPLFATGFRESAGQPYRPSNGAEGEMFQDRWCTHCTRDDAEAGMYCPIIAAAMAFGVEEDGYPEEWVYDVDGQPECTAFDPYRGRFP